MYKPLMRWHSGILLYWRIPASLDLDHRVLVENNCGGTELLYNQTDFTFAARSVSSKLAGAGVLAADTAVTILYVVSLIY
jgi:hypothetical protein